MRSEETVLMCDESATELNSELQYSEQNEIQLRNLTYEILYSLIVQIEVRFQDFES
jgi:hypothetical protein